MVNHVTFWVFLKKDRELSFFQRSNIHFITPLLLENSYQRLEEIIGIKKAYLRTGFWSMSKHTIR